MQRVPDSDNGTIGAREMLAELLADNQSPVADLRGAHTLCDEHRDVASASLIENWIDEAERRISFLYQK
jgi:starvation-inducible DNA-binding protein